jgi:hypothetical protein
MKYAMAVRPHFSFRDLKYDRALVMVGHTFTSM